MDEIIANELISHLSNQELKMLKKKIDATLEGDIYKVLNTDPSNIDLFTEVNEFLKAKEIEGKSQGTIKVYKYTITKMINYINKPVNYISTEDLRKYLLYLKNSENIADITLNIYRLYFNSLFNWLEENDYIYKNPCALIKPIKYEIKEREPLTDLEMELLRSNCETLRDKAILEVLYSTGCRVSELVGLKISNLDIKNREVYLFGKGKKHRVSYLSARAIIAINNYLRDRNFTSEFLFVGERAPHAPITTRTVQKDIKRIAEKAEISHRVTPHVIRHTTATDALDKGMSIEQVQILLGHEKIETTLIYAKCKKETVKINHFKYII